MTVIIDPSNNGRPIDIKLERETDPIRRHMLEEVRFHITTEGNLDFEAALQRLSPAAEYILYGESGPKKVLQGVDVIRREFYEALNDAIDPRHIWDMNLVLVDDHAVITEGTLIAAMRGSTLQAMGIDADPALYYLQEAHHMVVWPFDEQYRLIGETVFYGPSTPPEEIVKTIVPEENIRNYSGQVILPAGLDLAAA
jgi:hypothetical protein